MTGTGSFAVLLLQALGQRNQHQQHNDTDDTDHNAQSLQW